MLEVLELAGRDDAATSILEANAEANEGAFLVGDAGAQLIFGDAGTNTLLGAANATDSAGGADTLVGLGGSDTYRVYKQGDVVVEGSSTADTSDEASGTLIRSKANWAGLSEIRRPRVATSATASTAARAWAQMTIQAHTSRR